jgi:hypothetical protein
MAEITFTPLPDESAEAPRINKKGKSNFFQKKKKPVKGPTPPIHVVMGYIPDSTKKDVLQHARGYARDHLDAPDNSYVLIAPYRSGFVFEIQEGGDQQAYLPEILEALNENPDQIVWVPSGSKLNRAISIEIASGDFYANLLTEDESRAVRESGQAPLGRSQKMSPLFPKGGAVFATGLSSALISALGLLVVSWYSYQINIQPVPSQSYVADILPHTQIIRLSDAIQEDRWVNRIRFEGGQWRADFEEVQAIVLPDNRDEALKFVAELLEIEEEIQDRLLLAASPTQLPDRGSLEINIQPQNTEVTQPDPEDVTSGYELKTIQYYIDKTILDPEELFFEMRNPELVDLISNTPRLRVEILRNPELRDEFLFREQLPRSE